MKADRGNFEKDPRMERFMPDVQFQNSIPGVRMVETVNGGLSPAGIWEATEWLRGTVRQSAMSERPAKATLAMERLLEFYKARPDLTNNPERSLMCSAYLFALRLVKADKDSERNPNAPVIQAIVDRIGERLKKDAHLMVSFRKLHQMIGEAGDLNASKGNDVVFGEDILSMEGGLTHFEEITLGEVIPR